MSRLNLTNRREGHHIENIGNNDLDRKLTYQQLLNMNHDLAKENAILQNTSYRIGQELSKLQTQFEIKPTSRNDQNNRNDRHVELYNAINAHPILCQYDMTLIPLLDAYEFKIQEFQKSYQTDHEQVFSLEKKFEQICKENELLKSRITDLTKELIDVYKSGNNEKMHSDFGNIILDQINEKQRLLVDENAILQRDCHKYKAENQRAIGELTFAQQRLEESKSKLREYETSLSTLKTENASLSDKSFELQIKVNETEAEKRKLEQAHERAQSQNNQLNKEKQMYRNRLDDLKTKIERDTNIPSENDQGKLIEQLQTKIAFLEAEQGPNDTHKKYQKLQKDFDSLAKQKLRLKQTLQSAKIREDELNETVVQLKTQISKLNAEKSNFERNESKVNKSLETLSQKLKNDILKTKKEAQEDIEKVEFQLKHKIQLKDKKIAQLDEIVDKIKLQKDKLEKQLLIYGKETKQKPTKDSERALSKMKQKMNITEELFKEQLQILENDLAYRKKEADANETLTKAKNQELNRLRAEHEQLKQQYLTVSSDKEALVNQFRRVRNEYEEHLKQKQSLFQQKIKQIKTIVDQSQRNRKTQRQRVQQASRQYKKVLDDIRATYDARIRELENQVTQVQYTRKQIIS